MRKLKRLRQWVTNYWQVLVYTIGLLVLPLTFLLYKLQSATDNALLGREVAALNQALSKQLIFENPLDLIFKVPQYALRLGHLNNIFTIRLVPVVFGLITILAIYYVAKQWYGIKTAIATLLMVSSSSWFLAYGRIATVDIVYPMLVSLGLAYGAWLRTAKHSGLVMAAGLALGLSFVYTGGLVWLAILAIAWQRRAILKRIADAPRFTVLALVIIGVGISPLVLACIHNPSLINQIAGLPASPSESFANFGIRAVDIIQQFAVQGHNQPELGLINVALLDIFTYVMAILGLISLYASRKLDRFKVMIALLITLWLLVSLGGPVPIAVLLPVVYLLAAAGIGRLLSDWLTVFPRNPLARALGVGALSVAIGLSCLYHLQRYFIAWPEAVPTKNIVRQAVQNKQNYQNLLQ